MLGYLRGFHGGSDGKGSAWKITREGNGYPRQYSCLQNSMDRGAWWATIQNLFIDFFFLSFLEPHVKEEGSHVKGKT